MRADALTMAVLRYRIMAYVTGVVLMVLCFVGIPLQVFANNQVVVNYVGTTHGILYMIYLVAAFLMTRRVGLKLVSAPTVIALLAGTIPVLTFVVERWMTRRFINPALARSAAGGVAPAAAAGGVAPAAAPGQAAPASAPASAQAPRQQPS